MRALMSVLFVGLLAACGEPIKSTGADAKAAQTQARDAVIAAEDAAKRVDELSRQAMADPTKDAQQQQQ